MPGYHLDFNEGALGQVANGKRATGRDWLGEEFCIDLVHRAEVGDVTQQHGGLDHMLEIEALALEDGAGVEQALTGLFFNASLGEGASLGVDGQLT